MKSLFRRTLVFCLVLFVIMPAVAEDSPDLSEDEQIQYLYTNTTFILMGTMFLYFSNAFQAIAADLAELFSEKLSKSIFDERFEEKLNSLPADLLDPIRSLFNMLQKTFDDLKTDDPALYQRIFRNPEVVAGLGIARKYSLPEGYQPLYTALTEAELRQYIALLASPAIIEANPEHPVVRMYTELTEWLQVSGESLQNDKEVSAFFRNLQTGSRQ